MNDTMTILPTPELLFVLANYMLLILPFCGW